MQPSSATLHIGNYLGALKNWVALQDDYDCYYMIVDLHALSGEVKPCELSKNTKSTALNYLAAGLNPQKSTIFIQSHIHEHSELFWILSCITPVGELERMIQFKDKSAKKSAENINAGLLMYPVLQAADILLYKPYGVPVGEDQKQHLELNNIIARKFNNAYGKTFDEIEWLKTKTPRVMSLADPLKKMSKSAGEKHYIGLTDSPSDIRYKVMKAVTDTDSGAKKSHGVENLFTLLSACGGSGDVLAEFEKQYQGGTIKYKDLKEATAETIISMLKPIQERRRELESDPGYVAEVLSEGCERARKIAKKTMEEVKEKVGI